MNIESFIKARDFALIQSEVQIVDNKYIKVNILEVQQYWEADLESLFEFDILPDVKRDVLNDGWYYCSVLVEDYAENPDLTLQIACFDFNPIVVQDFNNVTVGDEKELPFA